MAEAAVMAFQSQEYAKLSMMFSGLELACQMQLNEALSASAAMSGVSLNETHREEQQQRQPGNVRAAGAADRGGGGGDRSVACAVQSAELRRRQQELEDQERAVKVGREDVAEEMRRRWHDKEFARLISEMPEEEWENNGDEFEKPFVMRSRVEEEHGAGALLDVNQVCNLYFGKSREDPGYVGMAWALTDATGHVLFQQTKFLGLGVSAYVADYTALINGLAYARSAGVRRIVARGDSALVSNQVGGQWRARSPSQVKFWEQVKEHQNELESLTVCYVPKSKNKYVMTLARQAIQAHVEKLIIDGQQIPSQSKEEEISEDCPICFESTRVAEMFLARNCSHKFCRSCLSQHVEVQVKENLVPVRCPLECYNHLELDQCQPYLPPKVLDAFVKRLTEASIPEADRVYCPFPNCSALMSKGRLNVSGVGSSSNQPHGSSIGRCECMACHRLFCVECRVPWHVGLSCAEYEKLPPHERNAEDVKLHQLARNQNWQRCRKCKHLIELNTGCYHMTCKCGYEFCYTCGAPWKNKQATCKCKLWDENNIIQDDYTDSDDNVDDGDYESDYEDEPDYVAGNIFYYEDDPEDFAGNIYYKTRICKHWANGRCWSGEDCNFAHGQAELRRVRVGYPY